MAVLDIMTYGSYTNKDAVRNVLAYVLRVRDDERRRAELLELKTSTTPQKLWALQERTYSA